MELGSLAAFAGYKMESKCMTTLALQVGVYIFQILLQCIIIPILMHLKKHKWLRRQKIGLGYSMVAMAKKSGLIICQSRSILFV